MGVVALMGWPAESYYESPTSLKITVSPEGCLLGCLLPPLTLGVFLFTTTVLAIAGEMLWELL